MYINKTVEYGLIAVAHVAKNNKEIPVAAPRVAKVYGIPERYLVKIMTELARANILKSKRGLGGGYTLARPAKEITMLEIIETLDKPLDHITELIHYTKLTKQPSFTKNIDTIRKDAAVAVKGIFHKVKISQMI